MTSASPPLKKPAMPLMAQQIYEDTRFILGMENGPREQWQTWQRKRLEEMLQWLVQAPQWAEYLKPVMKDGAIDMHAYDRWHEMPSMDRPAYRKMIESHPPRVPASHGALSQYNTSGSTGVPVTFWLSTLRTRMVDSHYWADGRRQGRPIDSAMLVLNGKGEENKLEDIERPPDPWLHAGPFFARYLPSFTTNENGIWLAKKSRQLFGRHKLLALATFPEMLSAIISGVELGEIPASRVDQIATAGQTVDPSLRERARVAMGASIRDRYSCEEVGPIAFQCPQSDDYLHVAVMNVIAEVVDDGGNPAPYGEQGRVLLTGLHQWASPVLRYEVGDIATLLESCPACGLKIPVFTNLLGRTRRLIRRANGELKYFRVISNDWLPLAPVREHRLVQVEPWKFQVELVLGSPLTADQLIAIKAMLKTRIGEEFSFEIFEKSAIVWPPGRKRHDVVTLGT